MSLAIQLDDVHAVLLADGWHQVHDHSFDLDAYEYLDDARQLIYGAGNADDECSTGFRFRLSSGEVLCGPITAILAVSTLPASEW